MLDGDDVLMALEEEGGAQAAHSIASALGALFPEWQ